MNATLDLVVGTGAGQHDSIDIDSNWEQLTASYGREDSDVQELGSIAANAIIDKKGFLEQPSFICEVVGLGYEAIPPIEDHTKEQRILINSAKQVMEERYESGQGARE